MASTLHGKRVLVTGATSGIGAAAAVACARAGADVVGLARRADRLQALQAEHGIRGVRGDVTDTAAAGDVVGQAAELMGGLDALVNSAGLARPGLIAEADPADWKAMFDTNVLGLLAITQAAIPHLLRSGPGASIINISSMSGRRVASPTMGTYSGTKYAVHAISESLRQELQPQGIRVTTISPGFVATEIFDDAPQSSLTEGFRALAARVGIAATDVADAIVHALAAPAAVTTVEIAMTPTMQNDARYAADTADDGD